MHAQLDRSIGFESTEYFSKPLNNFSARKCCIETKKGDLMVAMEGQSGRWSIFKVVIP